jgi:hypothetical protein
VSRTMLCLGSALRGCRRVALLWRVVVVLVAMVVCVGVVAVQSALAVPPPGPPSLASPPSGLPPAPPADPAPAQPAPGAGQPPVQPPPAPPNTAPSVAPQATTGSSAVSSTAKATLRLRGRRPLIRLSFGCASAGTARLTVRAGGQRWQSATKHYACAGQRAKVTVALSKSIARRLRKPSGTVAATLAVNEGSTRRTLAVNLGRAGSSRNTARAASGQYWLDAAANCGQNADSGNPNLIYGWVEVHHPPHLEFEPKDATDGRMWYYWRSGLVIWDGINQTYSYLPGVDFGTGETWSTPGKSLQQLDIELAGIPDTYGQQYTIPVGREYYTFAWVQTYYWFNGMWHGGEWNWVPGYELTPVHPFNGWCQFPG